MTDRDRFETLRQWFEYNARSAMIIQRRPWDAKIYQECADELSRVIAGETRPAPGMVWKTKENGK